MNVKYYTLIFLIVLLSCNAEKKEPVDPIKPLTELNFTYNKITGIGLEKGITRRDPSDVIKVNGICYVYYTKVIGRAAGYWGEIWYAASNDNGYTWDEKGRTLGLGNTNTFDSQAVFTPNIIKANGKYYLFYTGVKPTPGRSDGYFENNSITDITAFGLAVANNPNGPFSRINKVPVLKISDEPEKFDSYRIDDVSLLFKDNKYMMFYKGRSRAHSKSGPAHTQMGVAISTKPEGPYIKYKKPILDKSHEVLIWKQGNGVGALASISSTLEYSKTGLDFMTDRKNIKIENRPFAPGAFRADLTGGASNELKWGISMVHNGPECYLIRFSTESKKI